MRMPTLAKDYWRLLSGEERHAAAPATFEIPSLDERASLAQGQAAKLLFEVEFEDEDGSVSTSVDRLWVIVARKVGDFYVGILEGRPVSLAAGSDFYLQPGAEIPFLPEHVISIDTPPPEYSASKLAAPRSLRWPIEGGDDGNA